MNVYVRAYDNRVYQLLEFVLFDDNGKVIKSISKEKFENHLTKHDIALVNDGARNNISDFAIFNREKFDSLFHQLKLFVSKMKTTPDGLMYNNLNIRPMESIEKLVDMGINVGACANWIFNIKPGMSDDCIRGFSHVLFQNNQVANAISEIERLLEDYGTREFESVYLNDVKCALIIVSKLQHVYKVAFDTRSYTTDIAVILRELSEFFQTSGVWNVYCYINSSLSKALKFLAEIYMADPKQGVIATKYDVSIIYFLRCALRHLEITSSKDAINFLEATQRGWRGMEGSCPWLYLQDVIFLSIS